jgi:urease accessory protein
MSDSCKQWHLWLFADSALPTGSFNASSGLESAHQLGYISSITDLQNFVLNSLHNYTHASLYFVAQSFQICLKNRNQRLEQLLLLNKDCDCMLAGNPVARRASLAQGMAYISLMCKSFQHLVKDLDLLLEYKQQMIQSRLHSCFFFKI